MKHVDELSRAVAQSRLRTKRGNLGFVGYFSFDRIQNEAFSLNKTTRLDVGGQREGKFNERKDTRPAVT